MNNPVDIELIENGLCRLDINAGRLYQGFPQCLLKIRDKIMHIQIGVRKQDFSYEGIPIAVDPAGRQADDHISLCHLASVDNF